MASFVVVTLIKDNCSDSACVQRKSRCISHQGITRISEKLFVTSECLWFIGGHFKHTSCCCCCCWCVCKFHLHITSCGVFLYVSQSHKETAETVEVSSLTAIFRPDSAGTEHTVKVGRVAAVCIIKVFGGLLV